MAGVGYELIVGVFYTKGVVTKLEATLSVGSLWFFMKDAPEV